MAYDGWVEFNNVEMVNLSRSAQLAEGLGIESLWTEPDTVQWIQDSLGGVGYDNIANAPWYDAGYPASSEFAGIIPLNFSGLDDSSLTSTPIQYIGDGGNSGRARNATQPIVVSAVLIASTDRGAEYGKRWLDRLLKGSGPTQFCTGGELRYFRYAGEDAPQAHRRDVRTTRGATITRKRRTECDTSWFVSFTLDDADSYEYGDPVAVITELGPDGTSGPGVDTSGSLVLMHLPCAEYTYSPLYDPLYPALVPGPEVPDFYPAGWAIETGMSFERFWAVTEPFEPSTLNVIPTFVLTTPEDARMVKVSIWPGDAPVDSQCDPLFSAVVSYIPAGFEFTIDSEIKAAYVWDGVTPGVQRADSLIYSPDANPVQWTAFNDPNGLLVTIDLYGDSDDMLAADAQLSMTLTSKSD